MSFRVGNDILLDETNLTTTDAVSEVLDVSFIYGISLQAIATGTIAGTVQIEVSNDGVNFFNLASPTIAVSNATNAGVVLGDLFYKFIRIRFDATSGTTNTLRVIYTSKGI